MPQDTWTFRSAGARPTGPWPLAELGLSAPDHSTLPGSGDRLFIPEPDGVLRHRYEVARVLSPDEPGIDRLLVLAATLVPNPLHASVLQYRVNNEPRLPAIHFGNEVSEPIAVASVRAMEGALGLGVRLQGGS